MVENYSAHPNINALLTNIKLVFIPPNTTNVLQPMDAGIIRNLKHYYKKTVIIKMTHKYDSDAFKIFKITLVDAIRILDDSW